MAKKRRLNSSAPPPAGTPSAATNAGSEGPKDVNGDSSVSEADVTLAVRAVKLLTASSAAEQSEALLEAARPLIASRASKYEEDAKSAKQQQAAGKLSAPVKKQQAQNTGVPFGFIDDKPLQECEIGAALKALAAVAARPDDMMSKVCKPLRSALHPLVEAHLKEQKSSPAFQVTCMLSVRARWPEALRVLASMRAVEPARRPKLGAYQRWIRELNVSEGDPHELAMLDAVMRVAAGLSAPKQSSPTEGKLLHVPAFQAVLGESADGVSTCDATPVVAETSQAKAAEANDAEKPKANGAEEDGHVSTINKLSSLIAARREETAQAKSDGSSFGPGSWSVIAHEVAHERTPPNHFDLNIYTCAPGVVPLDSPPACPVKRHPLPAVTGAFVLSDVLSTAECKLLRDASEAIGYRPDVPLSSALDERAANVVLLATEQQNDTLYARVKDSLPQEIDGHTLTGINRRWRLYRYQEGNLYRKHLDGAWPASGVREGPKGRPEYVYDAFGGNTRSRLTFIVYLNDDFQGGETTFFVPKADQEGTLESRPVRPRTGCATVFPHGECGEPLLHEGSSVAKGCKYLLRTDVVYASPKTTESEKEAARLRGLARQLGGLAKLGGSAGATGADADGDQASGKKRKVIKRTLKGKARGAEGGRAEGGSDAISGKKRKFKRSAPDDAGAAGGTPAGKHTRADGSKRGQKGEKTNRRRHEAGKQQAKRANTARKNLHWRW